MTIVDNKPAAAPVQEANGQPEAGCEPLAHLAAEGTPAADSALTTSSSSTASKLSSMIRSSASSTNGNLRCRGRRLGASQVKNAQKVARAEIEARLAELERRSHDEASIFFETNRAAGKAPST